MDEKLITCPNCGKQFPLSEVAAQQIENAINERLVSERVTFKKQIKKDYDKNLGMNLTGGKKLLRMKLGQRQRRIIVTRIKKKKGL